MNQSKSYCSTKTMSLSNSLTSRSFLIVSLMFFLGLPLPLVIWLPSIWSTLCTTEPTSFLFTCPNHLSLVSTIFSTIGATPTLSPMVSFLILSCLVLPHIQHNILMSATLNYFCAFSLPPNTMSSTTLPVLQLAYKIFPWTWPVLLPVLKMRSM